MEEKFDCPICSSPMKVNKDFQIAKCQNNACGFCLNWSSPVHLVYSFYRLALKLRLKRRATR